MSNCLLSVVSLVCAVFAVHIILLLDKLEGERAWREHPEAASSGKSRSNVAQKKTLARTVCEIISGSNSKLYWMKLKILGALSGDADVGEQIYKKSKEKGKILQGSSA